MVERCVHGYLRELCPFCKSKKEKPERIAYWEVVYWLPEKPHEKFRRPFPKNRGRARVWVEMFRTRGYQAYMLPVYEHSNPQLFIDQQRQKFGIKYRLAPLPLLEQDEKQRIWLASAIDHDGTIAESRRMERPLPRFTYYYEFPYVHYATITPELAQKFATLTRRKPTIQIRAGLQPLYRFRLDVKRAIQIILYIEPYLIRLKPKAHELLKKYTQSGSIPLAPPLTTA